MTRALLILLVGCAQSVAEEKPSTPAPPPVTPPVTPVTPAVATPVAPAVTSCVDDAKPFDPEVMRTRLAQLADPALDGRAPGTEGDKAARALIVERFRCLGLAPAADDGFEQTFEDANGATTANVVGMIEGSSKPEELIVIGAHHDHLGGGFLGANDNASGVVGLLAVAQAVAQRETKPARSIVFVTFGAEEQGLVGSTYFVAHPPKAVPLGSVVQYINIDMIGSHASKKVVWAFGAFAKQPSRKQLAKLKFPKVNLGIGGHSVRGDHFGFCENKIPYVFFWTPDIPAIAHGLAVGLADSSTDLAASKAKIGCFGR